MINEANANAGFDEDHEDDDEPMFWDVLEEKYGRALTRLELQNELEAAYGMPLSAEEFNEELAAQARWQNLKVEWRARDEEIKKKKDRSKFIAEELYYELCSPPVDDEDNITDEDFDAWKNRITSMIKKDLDFDSLLVFLSMSKESSTRQRASILATKRHEKNHHAMEKVFIWCDANMSRFRSMDDAAFDIAETFVPQKFRTVRQWMTEWKKVRAAGSA